LAIIQFHSKMHGPYNIKFRVTVISLSLMANALHNNAAEYWLTPEIRMLHTPIQRVPMEPSEMNLGALKEICMARKCLAELLC
jgi:hypothetical protein